MMGYIYSFFFLMSFILKCVYWHILLSHLSFILKWSIGLHPSRVKPSYLSLAVPCMSFPYNSTVSKSHLQALLDLPLFFFCHILFFLSYGFQRKDFKLYNLQGLLMCSLEYQHLFLTTWSAGICLALGSS